MLRDTLFAAALFALTLTAWQLLVGSQRLESIGDLAWFGAAAFQILAPLQLAVAMPFSALLVASAVALEKDRKTLDLLLLTSLSNRDLVLGKLLAGMLSVIVVVVATLPLLMIIALLGRRFERTDLPRRGRDARQRAGRRQLGLDDRAVARKDISSAGDDGSDLGALALGLGNRRGDRRECDLARLSGQDRGRSR